MSTTIHVKSDSETLGHNTSHHCNEKVGGAKWCCLNVKGRLHGVMLAA